MLKLNIVSKDPQLNSFTLSSSMQFAGGEDVKVVMQLFQEDKKIRYIPELSASITVDLKKSDGTILSKTCSFTFADDRSIVEFSLSATESALVISQNLVVKVTETSGIQLAVLQYGLSRAIVDGSC